MPEPATVHLDDARLVHLSPAALARLFARSAGWARWAEGVGRLPRAQRDSANRRYWTLDQVPAIRRALAAAERERSA